MPAATNAVQTCEKACAQYEAEIDTLLDQFISAAESGREFRNSIDRVEEQLAAAKKLLSSNSDLELNETIVIAERTDEELSLAEKYAQGAALAETQEEWAGEMESVRETLDRLASAVRKMKAAGEESEPLEVRSAVMAFRRDEKLFGARLKKLRETFQSRKHSTFKELSSAKKRVARIKGEVGKAFDGLARKRLRKKTIEAKRMLLDFTRHTGACRVFIDAKHITLVGGKKVERHPLTQSIRFALEEFAPISKSFARLGKNGTVLIGAFERSGNGLVLRIGERSVVGDSVVLREHRYMVQN